MGMKTKKKITSKMKSKVKAIGGKKKLGKVSRAKKVIANSAKAKAAQKERIEKARKPKAKPKVSKPKEVVSIPLEGAQTGRVSMNIPATYSETDGVNGTGCEVPPYDDGGDDVLDNEFDEEF